MDQSHLSSNKCRIILSSTYNFGLVVEINPKYIYARNRAIRFGSSQFHKVLYYEIFLSAVIMGNTSKSGTGC